MTMKVSSPGATACWSDPSTEAAQLHESDGSPTWVVRGDQFVVTLTSGNIGTRLSRLRDSREYITVLPPGVRALLEADNQRCEVDGDSLTVMPPGNSTVTLNSAGVVARIFTTEAVDLAACAVNSKRYEGIVPGRREDWHTSVDSPRIRHYELAKYARGEGPLIRPRIFRTADLMVNAFEPFATPRPTSEVRPHAHADYDQASIALYGPWTHHLRKPWGPDMGDWIADQHIALPSPSVVVIPAKLIHTSRNTEPGGWLLDVFGSPRIDFLKSGIVLNADEYVMPPLDSEEAPNEKFVPSNWRRTA